RFTRGSITDPCKLVGLPQRTRVARVAPLIELDPEEVPDPKQRQRQPRCLDRRIQLRLGRRPAVARQQRADLPAKRLQHRLECANLRAVALKLVTGFTRLQPAAELVIERLQPPAGL